MKYIVTFVSILGLLLLTAGAVTGIAVWDARTTRMKLQAEREAHSEALAADQYATQGLELQLIELQDRLDRVEKTKKEALEEWNRRSSNSEDFDKELAWLSSRKMGKGSSSVLASTRAAP
jgi:hypothetical protein